MYFQSQSKQFQILQFNRSIKIFSVFIRTLRMHKKQVQHNRYLSCKNLPPTNFQTIYETAFYQLNHEKEKKSKFTPFVDFIERKISITDNPNFLKKYRNGSQSILKPTKRNKDQKIKNHDYNLISTKKSEVHGYKKQEKKSKTFQKKLFQSPKYSPINSQQSQKIDRPKIMQERDLLLRNKQVSNEKNMPIKQSFNKNINEQYFRKKTEENIIKLNENNYQILPVITQSTFFHKKIGNSHHNRKKNEFCRRNDDIQGWKQSLKKIGSNRYEGWDNNKIFEYDNEYFDQIFCF